MEKISIENNREKIESVEVLLPNYLNAIEFEPPLRLKKIKQNSK